MGKLRTLLLRGARPGPVLWGQLATVRSRTQLLAGTSAWAAKAGLARKGSMAGAGTEDVPGVGGRSQSQGPESPVPGPSVGKPATRLGRRRKEEVG